MASAAASNATSTWPTRLCICGAGPCIPRKSGSCPKNPGKWYYQCPRDPPCREWIGWCNESIPNVAHSQDDRSCHFTKSSEAIFPGEGIEEIGEGFGDSDRMRVHGGSFPQSQVQYQTPVGKGKDPIGQTSTVGGLYSSRKRKFSDAHEAMSASFAESVDRFKSTPIIVINRSGKWGIDNAIEKLDTLPFFEVEGQYVQFHSWACRLFERQQHKIDIFCQQKNLTNAIQWLRDEHTLAEERYYMTPPNQRRGIQPPPFPHVPENAGI